jgi:hypothetical protein
LIFWFLISGGCDEGWHMRRLVMIAAVGRLGSHPSLASAEIGVIGSYLQAD